MMIVIQNACNQSFTCELDGREAVYLGNNDYHEDEYNDFVVEVDMNAFENPEAYTAAGHCFFTMVRFTRIFMI